MSVIIRLQNLPWSANALDIRNFFRGLSIPEGGVHIVGGELGDAFIAFSTDEDARQAMMLDGGKIKEIQVKLLLSSRSEMHKVIEAARQSVPILSLSAPAPAPAVVAPPVVPPPPPITTAPSAPPVPPAPVITPFSAALGNNFSSFGIPGIGNPQEIPQPAVIEPPAPLISPPIITTPDDGAEREDERKRSKDKEKKRSRSRSRSRDRDRKDRKRDRRDRSRSRERRRRDRSRSRDRRDRKRDRKDRSRSRDRSPSRRSRDRRNNDRRSPQNDSRSQSVDQIVEPPPPPPIAPTPPPFSNKPPLLPQILPPNMPLNQIIPPMETPRFNDPTMADAYNKLQELGKKRNPNAFQGDQQNGSGRTQLSGGRGGGNIGRGGVAFRQGRSRFDNNDSQRDCCVAIRNAPNHTSYGDVRRFFPFMIDKHGIKMINDSMGRRTGNIFVRFCDPRSKHLALQRKNNELKGAEVIVETLEDQAYELAVDSFLPYRDDNVEEELPVIIPEPEEEQQPPFTVIKLADLPHFVKEHDIIKTFSNFSLLSIMLNDDRATRSKTAFVQFAKPEDAKIVLDQKERYMFGRRHPTITGVQDDEHEREKALQNERMLSELSGGTRNEPPSDPRNGAREEAQQQPAAPPQEPEQVGPRDPRQRRPQFDSTGPPATTVPQQGPAFFGNPFAPNQQFPVPFAPPTGAAFGGFPAPGVDPRTAAANWANRPGFPNQIGGPIQNQPPNSRAPDLENEPLDCVLMKGLPREATDRTIVTFLSDTGAVPARIHLMLDSSGMPSGDCFCEFRSIQEARMATTKHGQNLDGCRITVDLVTRSVVEEALEGPKQPDIRDGILGNPSNLTQPPPYFDGPPRSGFAPRGGFRGRGGYDRGGFDRGGFRGGFDSGRGGFDSGRGTFDTGRSGFDSGRSGFDSGRGGFDSGRGGYRGRGGFGDRGDRGYGDRGDRGGRGFDRGGRGRGFGRGRGGFENGRDRGDMPDDPDGALEDFGAPGCVVSMENVPFRASVDDILQFFADFELTQDDVIRRYNERGQPTGDARVAFRTPFDAQRAIKTRNLDTINDRRIGLNIL